MPHAENAQGCALKNGSHRLGRNSQKLLPRLQKLEQAMVGGERADDSALKERRMRRRRAAQQRLQMLSEVLAKVEDEDGMVLKVYDDIQEELRVKTEALRKNRQKVTGRAASLVALESHPRGRAAVRHAARGSGSRCARWTARSPTCRASLRTRGPTTWRRYAGNSVNCCWSTRSWRKSCRR